MSILLLDNYDSFTYNLLHYLEQVTSENITVVRNDKILLKDVNAFDKIMLSPGPGLPSEAGIMLDVIKEYSSTKSILGVCLGHQAIAEVFGGKLKNLNSVYHGVATEIDVIKDDQLFKNMPQKFKVGRYHSWVVDENDVPSSIEVISVDEQGYVMALRHKIYNVRGVQFHPESILTEHGLQLIKNWIIS